MDLKLLEDLEDLSTLYKLWRLYKKIKGAGIVEPAAVEKNQNFHQQRTQLDLLQIKNRSTKVKKRRVINRTRNVDGYYKTTFLKIKELHSEDFFIHTRMTPAIFNTLLSMVIDRLEKTSIRVPIKPEQRLALTLLYLSQGTGFNSLACSWKLGKETVRNIIYDTCPALWDILSSVYVSEPNVGDLQMIADDFWEMWHMPNCIGAIDGKHIPLVRPPSPSREKCDNIVLMAACDANYVFTYIDVGAYGSLGDGGIFQMSSLGKRILEEKLDIPGPRRLPSSNKMLPCYFVADAAIPLHSNIMKPFPGKYTSEEVANYNNRISRATQVINNSFGILTSRWRILLTTLHMLPENAEKIVLACVALHNFLLSNSDYKAVYVPPKFVDWADEENNLKDGLWRSEANQLISIAPSKNQNTFQRTASTNARNQLCAFTNNEGKIEF